MAQEDIKAIDIMNYPSYFLLEVRQKMFTAWEWDVGRRSTFKSSFGRVPLEKLGEVSGLPNFEAMLE